MTHYRILLACIILAGCGVPFVPLV